MGFDPNDLVEGEILVLVKPDYGFIAWDIATEQRSLSGARDFEVKYRHHDHEADAVIGFDVDDDAWILKANAAFKESLPEALGGMRRALARCFLWGTMAPVANDFIPKEDPIRDVIDEVVDGLPEGFCEITPALSREVVAANAAREAHMREGWRRLAGMMNEEAMRRGLTKEERKRTTVFDLLGGSQKQGDER